MSLTDTQLVLVDKLLGLGLVKEVSLKRDRPAGRTDENERSVGLKITRAGLKALGVGPSGNGDAAGEAAAPNKRSRKGAGQRSPRAASATDQGPRASSKLALVISLLSRAKGATLDDLVEATGWLPHTTRAALTGLRKKGHALAKSKKADGTAVYRIEEDGWGSGRGKDAA